MCVLKMKFLPLAVQKLSFEQTHRQMDRQTDRHADRHTDRQTQLKLIPTTYVNGKNPLNWESAKNIMQTSVNIIGNL